MNNAQTLSIEVSTNGGATWTTLATLSPTATSYAATGLDPTQDYEVQVVSSHTNPSTGQQQSSTASLPTATQPIPPPPRYGVIDLGANMTPSAMNNSNVVVGNTTTTSAPVLWSQGTTNSLLDGGSITLASVSGIADSGQMAGEGWSSAVTNNVPLYWASPTSTAVTLNAQFTDFGENFSYAGYSNGILMGGDGSMIGTLGAGGFVWTVVTYSPTGPPSYLWTFDSSGGESWSFATSKARGHWAGWYETDTDPQSLGAVVDGNEYPNAFAAAVNDSGVAVGYNQSGNAIIITGPAAGTLGPGGASVLNGAGALNNHTVTVGTNTVAQPQIIGYSSLGYTLWDYTHLDGTAATSYVAKNINQLIPTNSGWTNFYYPTAINDSGCICGTATKSSDGTTHGILLIPNYITRDGNMVNATNNTVCVGQQINLTNMILGSATNAAVTSYHWVIPGANNTTNDTAFYDYEPTVTSSNYTNLFTPTNYTTNSYCNFYWSSGGSNQVVYCTNVVYGQTNVVSAMFNVSSPQAKINATEGTIGINGFYLVFGTTNYGMIFSPTSSGPAGFAGTNQWVQVIQGQTNIVTTPTNTVSSSGCDTQFPYPKAPPGSAGTVDSPDSILAGTYLTVHRDFNATMYLMWQPYSTNALVNGDNTVLVPLRAINWNWSGTATNNSGWSLVPGSAVYPSNTNDFNVTSEPAWTNDGALP
jgi:hypothetical protein